MQHDLLAKKKTFDDRRRGDGASVGAGEGQLLGRRAQVDVGRALEEGGADVDAGQAEDLALGRRLTLRRTARVLDVDARRRRRLHRRRRAGRGLGRRRRRSAFLDDVGQVGQLVVALLLGTGRALFRIDLSYHGNKESC